MYLYCQKNGCGSYLGSLGGEFCQSCMSEDPQLKTDEQLEDYVNVLYCDDCGNYLGSLGSKRCNCGWHVGKE